MALSVCTCEKSSSGSFQSVDVEIANQEVRSLS